MFSMCKRLELAYDYVSRVFQSNMSTRRYDAFLKARPDVVYLKDVPFLGNYNFSGLSDVSKKMPRKTNKNTGCGLVHKFFKKQADM